MRDARAYEDHRPFRVVFETHLKVVLVLRFQIWLTALNNDEQRRTRAKMDETFDANKRTYFSSRLRR